MRPVAPPRVVDCFEQVGISLEVLDTMEALRTAAIEELKEAQTRGEAREIIEQLREDIMALFTEEQLAALQDCLKPAKPATCMEQLDLTPEQIELIDAIRDAAMEAIKEAEEPQAVRDIVEQMHQAIEDVLTEEQLAELRACLRPDKPVNCLDQIGLTEAQIEQIDAIRDAAMAAVQEAEDRTEVRAILDQMREDMMAVLTPEQITALEECRDANSSRRNGQ
jgi:Spy/CpxP family protein refolding chaperone